MVENTDLKDADIDGFKPSESPIIRKILAIQSIKAIA